MKKKKKKKLGTDKFNNYCKWLFTQQVNYFKFTGSVSFELGMIINIHRQFRTIINAIEKNNIPINDQLCPSIVKAYHDDITIKPFWNDKIQKLSDKLFLPSNDNTLFVLFTLNVFFVYNFTQFLSISFGTYI